MRSILVAVDGSAYSAEAVRVATDLARRYASNGVALISVVQVGPSSTGSTEVPGSTAGSEAYAVFAKSREILADAGIQERLLLRQGDPASEIVKEARTGGYDLIVVGSRGLSPFKAFLIGSVSQRVVSNAHCSVLVVRPLPEEGV